MHFSFCSFNDSLEDIKGKDFGRSDFSTDLLERVNHQVFLASCHCIDWFSDFHNTFHQVIDTFLDEIFYRVYVCVDQAYKSLLFSSMFKISASLRQILYLFSGKLLLAKRTVRHVVHSRNSARAIVTASCKGISRCVL